MCRPLEDDFQNNLVWSGVHIFALIGPWKTGMIFAEESTVEYLVILKYSWGFLSKTFLPRAHFRMSKIAASLYLRVFRIEYIGRALHAYV